MKKIISMLFIVILSASLLSCGATKTEVDYYGAYLEENVPGVVLIGGEVSGYAEDVALPLSEDSENTDATAALYSGLFNLDQNVTIYQEKITDKMYPASMTKLMTALLVFEHFSDLTEKTTITSDILSDLSNDSSMANLEIGAQYTIEDIMYGLLLPSGNDAANALAIAVSGSITDFVALMNERATELGMINTHFMNAHGLHNDNHYTTIYDLYLLTEELMKHSRFLDIISTPTYTACALRSDGTAQSQDFTNTNSYVRRYVDAPSGVTCYGGKTGTTNAAGRCLLMIAMGQSGDFYMACVGKSTGYGTLYEDMNTVLSEIVTYENGR